MTCQNCFKVGHNKKGCKEAAVEKPVRPKKKGGRPSKKATNVSDHVETPTETVPPASSTQVSQNVGSGIGGSVASDVSGSDIPGMHTPQ